jgi:ADP-heptose:LPS heptosyltransferase
LAKRILVVKFWALGDILMATPILRALKKLYPGCSIAWMVDQEYAGALRGNPLLDELIAFDSGTWRRNYRNFRWALYIKTSLSTRRMLKTRDYDVVIVLTPDKWWTLWFTVGKINLGLFPSHKTGVLGKFYDIVIPMRLGASPHNTDHYLETVRSLGATGELDKRMVCAITAEDQKALDEYLAGEADFDSTLPLVVLHPGTSQISKCWPTENFAELVDRLGPAFCFVVTGSAKERPLAESIVRGVSSNTRVFIAAGKLSTLAQTAALISRAFVVVTGDTSILHVSSATETPFVGIYGSTRPGTNAPLNGRRDLLFDDSVSCAPCYKATCRFQGADRLRCQTAIKPEMVELSVRRLLRQIDGS